MSPVLKEKECSDVLSLCSLYYLSVDLAFLDLVLHLQKAGLVETDENSL